MIQRLHGECEALIQPVQNGCQRSYAQLLRQTAGMLKNFFTRYLPNNDEVQDVIQETLLSVHRALPSYNSDRPYKPWVMAIARHRLNDYFRVRYAQRFDQWVELALSESVASEEGFVKTLDKYELISVYLDELPEKQRRILYLMHHEGYTAREVGVHLGMSETAVKVSAHRAYKTVRRKAMVA
jgi:RNA polymerase sigma-70 factor, ECF subfamily